MTAVEAWYPGDEDDQPWLRSPLDTDPEWEAFVLYRDAGPKRTLKAVGKALGHTGGDNATVRKWATEHGWRFRVNAYERYMDEIKVRARAEQVAQMEERHAAIAANALSALAQPLIALSRERLLPDGTRVPRVEEMERMATPELLRVVARTSVAMARLAGVERLSRGEPTDLVRGTVPSAGEGPVRPLPDEERLAAIFKGLEEAGFTAPRISGMVTDVEVIAESEE